MVFLLWALVVFSGLAWLLALLQAAAFRYGLRHRHGRSLP